MALETVTRDEFDKRLHAANERLRQELVDAQERVRRLETLIQHKEAFAQKLDRILAEIEQDEAQIATFEKELQTRRVAARRHPPRSAV